MNHAQVGLLLTVLSALQATSSIPPLQFALHPVLMTTFKIISSELVLSVTHLVSLAQAVLLIVSLAVLSTSVLDPMSAHLAIHFVKAAMEQRTRCALNVWTQPI